MRNLMTAASTALLVGLVAGCGESGQQRSVPGSESADRAPAAVERNPLRNAYFGDLHVHTRYSFDAYLFGTRNDPDAAYRFAKGEPIEHASGFVMQMNRPLDFQAVTDHAFYLGVMPEMGEGDGPLSKLPMAEVVRAVDSPESSRAAFGVALGHLREQMANPGRPDILDDRTVAAAAWQEIIAAAERHNDPGTFTTFIGYEYTTSGPANENLHRNVIFRGSQAPELPFSRLDSLNPEDLWDWMDAQRAQGREALAIPHNSNGSDGWMFQTTYFDGSTPIDAAYAEQRMRNEPLVENTQIKGTSDTHPLLSPNDEWADFEIMPIRVASTLPSRPPGSYVRDAYKRGLIMEETAGFNPYRFGVIGSSDTHNAAGSFREDNYWSKTGISDITPKQRGSVPLDPGEVSEVAEGDALAGGAAAAAPDGRVYANSAAQYWGASGLAGAWAESNTRDDLYAAFRRKETFSTSGPFIKVRFFGGYDLDPRLAVATNAIEQAYAGGVPMGGELTAREGGKPTFFAWASRDTDSQPLQRLQIVKGWVEDGQSHERVYDVTCSDGGVVDAETRRCPDNGARVDLATCATTPDRGAAELAAVWVDPDFDPAQRAFYYVRVLENPSCRWSTWDAIRNGVKPRVDMHATIQERAWSSPIWYKP